MHGSRGEPAGGSKKLFRECFAPIAAPRRFDPDAWARGVVGEPGSTSAGHALGCGPDTRHAQPGLNDMAKNKVIITCAITGSIHTPSMSPHLPITPDQIAESA